MAVSTPTPMPGPLHGRARWAAVWLCALAACRGAEPSAGRCEDAASAKAADAGDPCAQAVAARRPDAAEVCLWRYATTLDAATGARAARALQSRDGKLAVVEWIAGMSGDRPDGADAWLAAGVARRLQGDYPGAIAAIERAAVHRAPSDVLGRLHDAVGLLNSYIYQAAFQSATHQAVIAYELVQQVCRPDDRATTYLNIASLLDELGNLPTLLEVLDQARAVIPPTSRYYAFLRQMDGHAEQAREHPAQARRALLIARAFAIRDGDGATEFNVRMNLIEAALRDGQLDEAAALLAYEPPGPDATANDRAVDAYYRGWLAAARGKPRDAVQIVEAALRGAPEAWAMWLEHVHGRALRQAGDPVGAEQALRRAVGATEDKRDALEGDTMKSWMLAQMREPFEDLFLLLVDRGRLADALDVVQRATARSTLDGLLAAEPSAPAGLQAAGQRREALQKLGRALRSSRASATPPIAEVLARVRGNHIVTYFRARGEVWAIAAAADGELRARQIGGAAAIAARVVAWRHDADAVATAAALGSAVLPDELMPPPGAPLYIVADEPLAEVSFAALRRRGELVLDRNPVAYAPSVAVLAAMRRSRSPIRALVLGNPTGDLPQAQAEATEVAARLQVAPRLGPAATRAAVLDAGDATLIHIAAHTEPTPVGAALRMSDGLLDASAVLDHGVAAGAIVLLTCSSAAITSRDELAPLASAFVAAGAHTVVASRWSVDDAVGRDFAQQFYLADGVADPVRAVAAAQRWLAAHRVPVSKWSTFAVVGGLP